MKISDAILPLVWRHRTLKPILPPFEEIECWQAETLTGLLIVEPRGDVFRWFHGMSGGQGDCDSLEAAKLAAQQHFEATVLSVFKPKVFE